MKVNRTPATKTDNVESIASKLPSNSTSSQQHEQLSLRTSNGAPAPRNQIDLPKEVRLGSAHLMVRDVESLDPSNKTTRANPGQLVHDAGLPEQQARMRAMQNEMAGQFIRRDVNDAGLLEQQARMRAMQNEMAVQQGMQQIQGQGGVGQFIRRVQDTLFGILRSLL